MISKHLIYGRRLSRVAQWLLIFLSSAMALAQEQTPPPPATGQDSHQVTAEKASQQPEEAKDDEQKASWIIAPLPISSPALGTGIIPIFGYIFPLNKHDKVSPPSVLGAAGLITNNGSRGFATYGDLFLKQDKYRITAIYVRGNFNYDLYGIGTAAGDAGLKLPLEQSGQAFRGELLRRIGWQFFLGGRFWTGNSLIQVRSENGSSARPEPPPDTGLHSTLRAFGAHLKRDSIPNRFYPTTGTVIDFTSDFFSQTLGSKYSFQSYRFTFNKYASLSEKQILAYNLFVCGTGGEPPVYGQCIFGTNNELRGYTAGQYIDRYMFATQLEYRLSLPWRLGIVGFGGVGEVVPGGTHLLRANNLLPAGGGGPRFELSKTYRVNLRADFGRGKDNWTWSMGVGEAF